MARKSDFEDDVDDDVESTDDLDQADDGDDATGSGRAAAVAEFWSEVRIQPVEIALPKKGGYTLRAYRLSTEVEVTAAETEEDEFAALHDGATDDEDALPPIDEEELTRLALAAGGERPRGRRARVDSDAEAEATDEDDEDLEEEDLEPEDKDAEDESAEDAEDESAEDESAEPDDEADSDAEAEAEAEEVPVFLTHRGRLLVFESPEGLVEYVRTADEHDLVQLDTWAQVRERIEASHIEPLDDDRYELDLVVENLRGGHDAWDPALIIQAGEIARDLGYALRLPAVVNALAPGSPLDDLDEGLRTVEEGGIKAFMARRRLRKIGAQTTAALGWRTIIGKISAAVDWRN